MKTIPLYNSDLCVLVDDADYEMLTRHQWGLMVTRGGYRYARASTRQLMHRVITAAPDGMRVDHRDGDGLNNTRQNLRICTPSQNVQNSRTRKNKRTSTRKGVAFCKRPGYWRATIRVAGKSINLGNFKSEDEAAQAYRVAAERHFGEFARLD